MNVMKTIKSVPRNSYKQSEIFTIWLFTGINNF